jgi:hypothetical protein
MISRVQYPESVCLLSPCVCYPVLAEMYRGHLHVRFKPTTLFAPSPSVDILIVFYGLKVGNFECKMHYKMREYQPLFLPIDGSKILGPGVVFATLRFLCN